ncbi:MAG: type II toxin-antitoxin system HicA family toxin [Rhodospirillales bacterium]|nr:type II toxin-antitoxin system HicA family toxin [Rhodospirillales bacterium]
MKLPRNVSGQQLAKALATYGYAVTRQSGSHMRLTTTTGGQHHLTIPDHSQLRLGTLAAIVADVAQPFGSTREEVAKRLFG